MRRRDRDAALKRSFRQFLTLSLLVVLGFILLGVLIYGAHDAWSHGRSPDGLKWLGNVLGDSQALGQLLSTVASGIITVTSITLSLSLIALQQGAAALTTHVTDQFLMRRINQFYFGFFVGLSIFVLQTLVTVSDSHRPIFGTTVALLLDGEIQSKPGRDVVNAIRDIVARWSAEAAGVEESQTSSIIYADNTAMEAINVLEMIVLVASKSIQAQTLTDAFHTITMLLDEAPQPLALRLADVVDAGARSLIRRVAHRNFTTLGQPASLGGATRVDDVPIALKACAGSPLTVASDTASIPSAFTSLFLKASPIRLTN